MEDFVLTIKVNDGDLFEGNLRQWEECFFSFPLHYCVNKKIEEIQNFCHSQKYNLILSWKNKNQDNNSQILMTVK